MIKSNFYIFTGGPGSGKTTLLNALEKKGYQIMPEVGRAIIQVEQLANSEVLPWKDKQLFYQAMLSRSVSDYQDCDSSELVLWDRGIIDSIGYATLEQLQVTELQRQIARELSFNPTVFILPPWQEIYTQDKQRKQDMSLAIKTYEVIRQTYLRYGYSLVEVPKSSVEQRTEFIVSFLKNKENEA
ncbi:MULTISPECIES: AAA family ATPase [Myroides]|uniref:AAA family ATPase n=1 Tax=Myroides albus TaxID=2562892 RepID=A0A6I3LFJ2_9FLAO|nr:MULTISPECIES: AAA family ATPase [Myroides]MTG98239.1 AAA family ATPase [Myroides albus]MVX35010.1 AAA family ATPase [Myroides sp. LoEW2-1]